MLSHDSKRIAVFASGSGSNAEAIIRHLYESVAGEVVLVCSNKANAGVIARAWKTGVPCHVMPPGQYRFADSLSELMQQHRIDLIALAGYLKLLPTDFTRAYDRRILNIHPSLLPAYGGKGMYGMHVHKAVIAAGEKHSGITVHYVNEVYDQGEILLQKSLPIQQGWSASELQQAVLKLEHYHYPRVIEAVCKSL